jgi:hypothetical protein
VICCTGNHPQGDFATFSYRAAMKVKNLENPFISWLFALTMCRNMMILKIFFKFWRFTKAIFGNIIFLENIFLANRENSRCLEMKELTKNFISSFTQKIL